MNNFKASTLSNQCKICRKHFTQITDTEHYSSCICSNCRNDHNNQINQHKKHKFKEEEWDV